MLLHIFNCFDWFISRRKLFQKLFENVFEVLEKEKEIEIISFSASGRKPPPLLSPFGPAASLFSLSRGPRLRAGPSADVAGRRASLPFPLADTPGPRHSGVFHFSLVFEPDSSKESDAAGVPLPCPARLAALK
jgi:hypothetical protein